MATQTALYKKKNDEMNELITELTKVEEQLTMKLAYADDKVNRTNLEQSIRIIAETKENLVSALGSLSTYYTSNLENASDTLEQQTEAIGIIDREMQIAKKRLSYVNEQKANKLRKVEINQYYAANYREKTLLLKWFLLFIAVLIVFYYVKGVFTGISPLIYALLLTIIILFFGYKVAGIFLSLNARSKMVYDEYAWKFDTENAPQWDPEVMGLNPFKLRMATCVGEVCCSDGTLYNKEMGRCFPEVSALTGKCSAEQIDESKKKEKAQ